jgi:hypothetical protein
MSAARLKSLGKLVVLIGLPVSFVVGLFGAGVYVGHGHQAAILGFERDWLGLDVTVPGEPSKPTSETTKPEVVKPEPKPEPEPGPPVTTPEPKPEVKPETRPEPVVETPKPETPKPETPTWEPPRGPDPIPVSVVDPAPLAPELQAKLAEPLKIRVKVVVDEEVAGRRSDWIDYVERHVRWASQVLQRQLGVELELRGIVAWPTTWPSGQVAFGELASVGSDGADLVIGLGGRNVRTPVQAAATNAKHHASTAIAFGSDPTSPAPHLRGLLRAVTHAMGGDPISADNSPIAFTDEDRRIILERKHLPFTPEAEDDTPPAQPAEDAAPEGDN